MKLERLFNALVLASVTGNLDQEITGIEMDSRLVKPGDLFIAVKGFTVNGHDYIPQAIKRGAVAILVEENIKASVSVIQVPDSRRAMAVISDVFFQHPTHHLKLIGITGTNGKTTTAHLVKEVLEQAGKKTGMIGTIHMQIGEESFPVQNTTPEVLELQRGFRQMIDAGCTHGVIEASSHALHMGRTRGCRFQRAVFTNLTQDHLDYHETMEHYRDAKGLLFQQLDTNYHDQGIQQPLAILNSDDPASHYFAQVTAAQVITYGIFQEADVRGEAIQYYPGGTRFHMVTFLGSVDINMKLMGRFSVYNALAAAAIALGEGLSLEKIQHALATTSGVAGRVELIDEQQPFTVVVDYAHTPDSLENLLTTVRESSQGNLWCVFGCGGDRDRSKRPLMAAIAGKYSDHFVITTDNPRTEDPQQIMQDMVQGIKEVTATEWNTILDRGEAISYVIKEAKPGDVVVIAGKGHESYQEIQGVRYDFDDRQHAREAIKAFWG